MYLRSSNFEHVDLHAKINLDVILTLHKMDHLLFNKEMNHAFLCFHNVVISI